ncbi:HAD family hydrolase [Vibrio cidicii]|nr:HAD family hydrolase [Vibrio cidicii]
MPNPLYVFDLDKTLINGDCAMIWNAFLAEKGIATDANFVQEDQRLMALYDQGKMNMADYLAFTIAPLTHLPIEEVHALATECVERDILPKQFSQAKTLIAQLQREGIDMLIISASVSFLVKAVAQRLGIKQAIGIDLQLNGDRYSTQISGIPSYREGKVTRLKEWLKTENRSDVTIHFYTDSINDLPLCQYADVTYLVNPCPQLEAYSAQTKWTKLKWY